MPALSPPRKKIPVSVVSGFLGSGKTTLINALLARDEMARTLVIVNEFGDVGIDAALIESALDDVVLLSSGCICCSIRGDLRDTLTTLLSRLDAGAIAEFDRILIETSGISDPGPVLHLLAEETVLTSRFAIGNSITVVDPTGIEQQMASFPEAARQLALADIVVLSKVDLVQPEDIEKAQAILAASNPLARHMTRAELVADIVNVLDSKVRMTTPEPMRRALPLSSHQFRFQSITRLEALDWDSLVAWLGSLLSLRGDHILRIKGLVRVEGNTRPVVLHCVQNRVYQPESLPEWPTGYAGTQLIFITTEPGLPGLQQAFDAAVR